MSGDDRSWHEREKKSFSELDRLRREGGGRGDLRPQGKAAQERSAAATKQYLRAADEVFGGGRKGDAARLGQAVRDALGTAELPDACRAYLEAVGLPTESALISCFLDAGERTIVLEGLRALEASGDGAAPTGSVRSQLRMLAEDSDDEIAEIAEGLLESA